MPKRPISHRLEAESISAFEAAIPKRWVTREKRPDYGVDLEVEIFDVDDNATGIVFNVQLKASGSPKAARRPRLKVESLDYLNSLDVPTLVVAYCATDKKIFHKWHFEIAPDGRPDGQYIHVIMRDENEWDSFSVSRIEDTLRTWKALRSHPSTKQIPLLIQMTAEADLRLSNGRMKLANFFEGVAGFRPTLTQQKNGLQLSVAVDIQRVSVAIPFLSSLTVELEQMDEAEIQAAILYCLSYILYRSKLLRHAELLALHCEKFGIRGRNRQLAVSICQALTSSAVSSARLAISNDLHLGRDGLSTLVLHHLSTTHFSANDEHEALETFVAAAIGEAPDRADFRYSLGNHFAGRDSYLNAVLHFNAARRIDPEYCKRSYFLAELGASLYSAGRYTHAARCYEASLHLDDDQKTRLFLGDALLFSGRIEDALREFEAAAEGANKIFAMQASLKRHVSAALVEKYGAQIKRAHLPADFDTKLRAEEALSIDPFDNFSNFNAGVASAQGGDHISALYYFLVAAFARAGDEEAWTNALLECLNSSEFVLLEYVLYSALGMGGPKVVMSFRDRLASLEAPEVLEVVDGIVAESESYRSHKAILRVHDGEGSFRTAYRDL